MSKQGARPRYHPLVTRALLFFFWRGELPGFAKMTPAQIFQRFCSLIREGHFGDVEGITEAQIKQWLANRASIKKRQPELFQMPDWIDPENEFCIFEQSGESVEEESESE